MFFIVCLLIVIDNLVLIERVLYWKINTQCMYIAGKRKFHTTVNIHRDTCCLPRGVLYSPYSVGRHVLTIFSWVSPNNCGPYQNLEIKLL